MKILDHRFHSAKADGPDATQVQPSHWNDGHAFTGGAAGQALIRDPTDVAYGAKWAPFGQWTNVPYDPANFVTISAGVAWNVAPANVQTHKYCVVGQLLHYHIALAATSVASATVGLVVRLPTGYTLGSLEYAPFHYTIAGVNGLGYVLMNPGAVGFTNALQIIKLDTSPWQPGVSTDVNINFAIDVTPPALGDRLPELLP